MKVEGVPPAEVHDRALEGEIVTVRECLDVSWVPWGEQGPERIHEVRTPEQLVDLTEKLERLFRERAGELLRDVLPQLGWPAGFYYERQPNVRIHVPYEAWKRGRKQYLEHARVRGDGKLNVHAPHRDSDHGCPTNAVNLWLALGRVQPHNGLCLYPAAWRAPKLTRDSFHPAVNFKLAPGDAVVFAGEHLHTSELNTTEESRCVVSFRCTGEAPRYRSASLHDYVCSAPSLASRVQDGARRAAARVALKLKPHEHPELVIEPGPGPIRAISESECEVTLASGRVVRMPRRCPHQGTDLAAVGQVCGEKVICPWHNLEIEP